MSDRHEAFERRLAEWGGRPASTPAAIAGHRVMRSVLARPARTLPWRFAAAALVAVGAALVVWRVAPPGSPLDAGHPFPSARDENVVVWIVDPETTVLHVLEPLGSREERR